MKPSEAIKECERWWAYLERQKEKSLEVQKLAALARTGPVGQAEAQKRLRQLDTKSITVYDGTNLCEATQCLVALVKAKLLEEDNHV